MSLNFTDFYILYPGHPRFNSAELIEDDLIRVIVQKYQMIIFTNKGDVYGMPDFGANLLELLHNTVVSSDTVKEDLINQINNYIPEMNQVSNWTLDAYFYPHPEGFQEVLVIDFFINGVEVSTLVS